VVVADNFEGFVDSVIGMKAVKENQLQRKLLATAVAACFVGRFAYANPVGPVVVSGQATFAASGRQLAITNTPGTIINWQQFSIQSNEATRFIQQSASSAVLNRVVGVDPSQILGTLQSNGRIFLINPNGILFGAGAQIDVAGLVASTLNLRNEDFIAGRMNFGTDAARAAAIVNQGRITASNGGGVFLVGGAVDNQGVITAPNGDIVLAAGKSVRVAQSAAPGLQVEITAPVDQPLNLSDVTYSSRGIYSGLVRNSGIITANSVVRGADGRIVLRSSGDVTLAAGSSTTANGVNGGTVSVYADGISNISGVVEAKGDSGAGGTISLKALIDTTLESGSKVSANGASGGTVSVVAGGNGQRLRHGRGQGRLGCRWTGFNSRQHDGRFRRRPRQRVRHNGRRFHTRRWRQTRRSYSKRRCGVAKFASHLHRPRRRIARRCDHRRRRRQGHRVVGRLQPRFSARFRHVVVRTAATAVSSKRPATICSTRRAW